MLIVVILLAMLADNPPVKTTPVPTEIVPPTPTVQPAAMDWDDPRVVAAIKSDFESIAGPGSVAVDRAAGRLFNIRIAVPTLSSEFCNPIYDHEIKLFRLFPDLNFDFYLRLRDPE